MSPGCSGGSDRVDVRAASHTHGIELATTSTHCQRRQSFNLCEGSTCSGGKRCKHGLLGEVLRVCQELFGVHQVKKTVPVMANQ